MKKIAVICLTAVFSLGCFNNKVQAQDYTYGFGFRLGYYPAITFKYNFNPPNSLEFIGTFKKKGFDFTTLYERHVPVIGNRFNFYYGVGGNIGSWKKDDKHKFTVGGDAIVGLEYKIHNDPIVFSLDFKPQLNFVGHTGFQWHDIALSVRYVF